MLHRLFIALLFALLGSASFAQSLKTIPEWTFLEQEKDRYLALQVPQVSKADDLPQSGNIEFLLLDLDPEWQPQDWRQASFDLKNLIVVAKTRGNNVEVAIEASESQLQALMQNEMAPYIDAYVFDDMPFIPDGDATGRLWQSVLVDEPAVVATLVDAGSIGVQRVLFGNLRAKPGLVNLLDAIQKTDTGSLDLQPEVALIPKQEAQFFFNPQTGNYHLAVYGNPDGRRLFSFTLAENLNISAAFPEIIDFDFKPYGRRSEITLKEPGYFWFLIEPQEKSGTLENLEIVERKSIDPYELVVKNQVFKDAERQKFQSLMVDELVQYRYQAAGGASVEAAFEDTLVERLGKPRERIRTGFIIGGVRWPYEEIPQLPLIQPEKVQREPLTVELDKAYVYEYQGEDTIDGHATWKVGFKPGETGGKFFRGSVWIDQKTGAHRKLRAIQLNMEAPVVGNEMSIFYDWVEDGGTRYWTAVRQQDLQIINAVSGTLPLQIDITRSNYRFNRDDVETKLKEAYASDVQILRDTQEGFKYFAKQSDGSRELKDGELKLRALLGGAFFDPSFDYPIPLAGFNYTNLNFRDTDLQVNAFVAGAVNDIIVSNPDFLGRGWDLSAELFVSALHFGDEVFENGEEIEEEEVGQRTNSFNVSLGIPINSFFKFTANYRAAFLEYDDGDDMSVDFVLPTNHVEHGISGELRFNRGRFTSALEYGSFTRSEWEDWGFVDDEQLLPEDFRTLSADMAYNWRIASFQTLRTDVRYLKGWDLDRFSRFGFGFFENSVSGFGSSGIEADEAVRMRVAYDVGVKGLFQLTTRFDAARTWRDELNAEGLLVTDDPVDLYGVGVAANFIGPWKTLLRLNVGYGLHADLEGEDGDFTGQIVFLKLF
jgi:hypothetical protein